MQQNLTLVYIYVCVCVSMWFSYLRNVIIALLEPETTTSRAMWWWITPMTKLKARYTEMILQKITLLKAIHGILKTWLQLLKYIHFNLKEAAFICFNTDEVITWKWPKNGSCLLFYFMQFYLFIQLILHMVSVD